MPRLQSGHTLFKLSRRRLRSCILKINSIDPEKISTSIPAQIRMSNSPLPILLANFIKPSLFDKPPLSIPCPQSLSTHISIRINGHYSDDIPDSSICRYANRATRHQTPNITNSFFTPVLHLAVTNHIHDCLQENSTKPMIPLVRMHKD